MRHTRTARLLLLASLVSGPGALAQATDKKGEGDGRATAQDLADLRAEVRDLRALLGRLLEVEQQRSTAIDEIARDLRDRAGRGGGRRPPPQPAAEPMAAVPRREPPPPHEGGDSGSISGQVRLTHVSGHPPSYVYVEDLQEKVARGKTREIKQADKQFQPQSLVVQRGTRVVFPNLDSVFHNVFSLSKGNTFDLGTYRAGDKPGTYVFLTPGVVDIFCNMHSQMNASVLVVPNHHFTQVGSDGSFKLDGVPAGKHRVIAWTPNAPQVAQQVTVRPHGDATVDFTLEGGSEGAPKHNDKFGMPYGSYQ